MAISVWKLSSSHLISPSRITVSAPTRATARPACTRRASAPGSSRERPSSSSSSSSSSASASAPSQASSSATSRNVCASNHSATSLANSPTSSTSIAATASLPPPSQPPSFVTAAPSFTPGSVPPPPPLASGRRLSARNRAAVDAFPAPRWSPTEAWRPLASLLRLHAEGPGMVRGVPTRVRGRTRMCRSVILQRCSGRRRESARRSAPLPEHPLQSARLFRRNA
mmetsp:Transcript_29573/g.77846  ORF Transcript_29573/g.77846 Transcript_29573/m.77846 type:complete len:225 (+) Transcript_29573:1160-1834(+)